MSARSKSLIEISDNSEGFLFSETGYLKFSPDSKTLFAASQDGQIYKFDYNSSSGLSNMLECSSLALPLNERIGKISVSNSGDVAVASESNELVRLYKMKDGKFEDAKLVTKCVGSTDALAINSAGTILCCSGKDNNVKVINIKDPEFPVLNQIPSTHFVRSICFSENGAHFAMLQVDGILKIFKIVENNPAPQLIKTLTGPKSDINGNLQMSWKDNVLGVLYGGDVLRVYETDNWTIKSEMALKDSALHFEIVSKNAALIACKDGNISIYSIARNAILTSDKYSGNLENCSVASVNEQFACVFDSSKSDLFSIKMEISPEELQQKKQLDIKFETKHDKKHKKEEKKNKFDMDEAEANTEEDGDEEDEDGEDLGDADSERSVDDNEDNADEYEDDTDNNSDVGINDFDNDRSIDSVVRNISVKKHPVVQPCCTPWRNLQRYLAYNNVGFITARRQLDESENLINYDIEFMDRNAHNPIRFSDSVSFSIAAIHEKGAVLASDGPGGCLKYVSFENSEDSWTITVNEATLVGISRESVFVVNSRGILSIYSLSGLLKASATCPGRPFSLICPEGNEVYLFTEDSEGILCYRLDSRCGGISKGTQASRVLLGSSDQVTWCGLSFSGVLGAFTSSGKLSLLLTGGGCDRWTEILDTSKTLSDKFELAWPVYFDVNVLSAVVCKYTDSYPDPYPAPHVIDFNFRIPELSTYDSYEEIVRTNWILNETTSTGLSDREKKKLFASSDRHLLELAQLSIKSNKICRLKDLATWASNEKTFELLIQLAKHHKLVAVVKEIEVIKAIMFKPISAAVNAYNAVNTLNNTTTIAPTTTTWSTPKLPEVVAKESPSGILANLTPMKTTSANPETAVVSSPAELASSPTIQSNPFAKNNENVNPAAAVSEKDGSAMMDYISAMMKMNSSTNNNNKRKAEEASGAGAKKSATSSSLSSNVFTNNTQ